MIDERKDKLGEQSEEQVNIQELLHIFQFDDINQKFTAILILVKSISGYRVLHYEVQK